MSLDEMPADAPMWARVLAAKIDRLQARPAATGEPVMISASQADRLYRLRQGTVRATWEHGDGRLKGQLRRGRGPTGQVLYVDRADCDRIWKH